MVSQMTGVAMRRLLLVLSIGIGFVLAVPLSSLHEYQKIFGCVAQFGYIPMFSWHSTLHSIADYLLRYLQL